MLSPTPWHSLATVNDIWAECYGKRMTSKNRWWLRLVDCYDAFFAPVKKKAVDFIIENLQLSLIQHHHHQMVWFGMSLHRNRWWHTHDVLSYLLPFCAHIATLKSSRLHHLLGLWKEAGKTMKKHQSQSSLPSPTDVQGSPMVSHYLPGGLFWFLARWKSLPLGGSFASETLPKPMGVYLEDIVHPLVIKQGYISCCIWFNHVKVKNSHLHNVVSIGCWPSLGLTASNTWQQQLNPPSQLKPITPWVCIEFVQKRCLVGNQPK